MTARRRPSPEAGFFSLHALFVGVLLFGVSVAFLTHGLAETRTVDQYESTQVALELAETGLIRSEMEFRSQVDAAGDGLGAVTGEWRGGDYATQTFEVQVTPAGAGLYTLRAIGTHCMAVRRVEVGLRVTKPFVFQHALFARDSLTLDSSFATDSYDSRLGTYASQARRSDALGSYADPTGHVGSNMSIEVRGSVIVRGDARPGPGRTSRLIGGSSRVMGSRVPMTAPFDVTDPPLEDFQAAYATNDDARDVRSGTDITWDATRKNLAINGNATVRLRGGTYFFNNLTLDSNATLQVDAASTIYVTGNLRFDSSSRINFAGSPQTLKFVAHPYALVPGYTAPTTPITLNSSMVGRFTLYAPGRDVELNSSIEIFGAIVGRRILATSSGRLHFDRALLSGSGAGAGVLTERLYWRELSPPPR